MRGLRAWGRSVYLLLLLLTATVDGRFISRPKWGAEGAVWIHRWCRRIVRAMGIEYTVEGVPPENGAVVSNHLSYVDVMVYSAIRPFVMVAKREVRDWPLLGWLTAQAGTVYVRRSEDAAANDERQSHAQVNALMAEAYASGLPVLFFPEGTTTDGSAVLPFRRGLFHSVLHGGVALRTAALRLDAGEGEATDVCFVGDALLAPHLFRLLGLRKISATVRFGDVVTGKDRFALAAGARAEVVEMYEDLRGSFNCVPHDEGAGSLLDELSALVSSRRVGG